MTLKENLSVKHLVKEILQQAGVTKHKRFLLLSPTHRAALCALSPQQAALQHRCPEKTCGSGNLLIGCLADLYPLFC